MFNISWCFQTHSGKASTESLCPSHGEFQEIEFFKSPMKPLSPCHESTDFLVSNLHSMWLDNHLNSNLVLGTSSGWQVALIIIVMVFFYRIRYHITADIIAILSSCASLLLWMPIHHGFESSCSICVCGLEIRKVLCGIMKILTVLSFPCNFLCWKYLLGVRRSVWASYLPIYPKRRPVSPHLYFSWHNL